MSDYCSVLSLEAVEPLHATVVTAKVWAMLEYRQPWHAKATTDHALPPDVAAGLDAQLAALDGRLQFIRQMGRSGPGYVLFVGVVDDVAPVTYRFELDSYHDLAALDLAEMVARAERFAPAIIQSPVTFVCTNGKRDRCCAMFGAATYRRLDELAGDAVWQTTHLGGHRFAPTLLTLPDGLCYGRMTAASAEALIQAQLNGDMLLDQLRGRACYDTVTQAAETFLRRETGISAVAAFRHLSTEAVEAGWRVHFSDSAGEIRHTLDLAPGAPLTLPASCDSDKLKLFPQIEFVRHEITPI